MHRASTAVGVRTPPVWKGDYSGAAARHTNVALTPPARPTRVYLTSPLHHLLQAMLARVAQVVEFHSPCPGHGILAKAIRVTVVDVIVCRGRPPCMQVVELCRKAAQWFADALGAEVVEACPRLTDVHGFHQVRSGLAGGPGGQGGAEQVPVLCCAASLLGFLCCPICDRDKSCLRGHDGVRAG